MKGKKNEGFSLVEVLVSMAILTAIVIPVCTGMVQSAKLNARAEEVMRARIAVSSAVEKLKAEGIDAEKITVSTEVVNGTVVTTTSYSQTELPVQITIDSHYSRENSTQIVYYNVSVSDLEALVTASAVIQPAPPKADQEGPKNEEA